MQSIDNNRLPAAGEADRLRDVLNRLAGGGRGFLQRWRLYEELRAAAGVALRYLFVLPLALWFARLGAGVLGVPLGTVTPWLVAGLAVLGPVLYVLGRLFRVYLRYHPRRHSSLALYDAELRTHDRLVTADEFMQETAPLADARSAGFKLAAVADADRYAHSALQAMLSPLSLPQWQIRPSSWLVGVPATVLVALLLYFSGGKSQITPDAGNGKTWWAQLADDIASNRHERARAAAPPAKRPQNPLEDPQAMQEQPQLAAEQIKNRKSRSDKSSEGRSNTGNAALAQASNTSSNATGEPSSQKNASKPRKPEEQKPEEEDAKKAKRKPRKTEEQKSSQLAMSATSGTGKSSMSASSPSQFDMPEEDDKAGPGEKSEGADEEAEDEDEQEKSNSVNKPTLKDKKPPSNRELIVSSSKIKKDRFEKPGMRGSEGFRKKTRGVPSMILGIPVPDRLQGMPNPGRSKVTQENAKPKEEAYAALDAQMRLVRADAIGEVERPDLLPWMRLLVADYFIALRKKMDFGGDSGVPDTQE